MQEVLAVIATFRPPDLAPSLARLAPQVGSVLVADDASPVTSDRRLRALSVDVDGVVRFASNAGIGRSLNAGLDFARDRGAAWLLTLDQDTLLATDHVTSLLVAAEAAEAAGMRVGAAGVESVAGLAGSLVIPTKADRGIALAEELIQSGTLWNVAALTAIGGFD